LTRVGVVGAGVMGAGVAQNLATAGHDVTLVDIDPDAVRQALSSIETNCRMSTLLGGPPLDSEEVLARIVVGTSLQALADSEVVIENIT
jgi:3-hydroxybutyryl-CoA dehydrogenase